MEFFRKAVCIILSINMGALLLSGAGVMFESVYMLPPAASRFLVMLIVFIALVQWSLALTSRKKPSSKGHKTPD